MLSATETENVKLKEDLDLANEALEHQTFENKKLERQVRDLQNNRDEMSFYKLEFEANQEEIVQEQNKIREENTNLLLEIERLKNEKTELLTKSQKFTSIPKITIEKPTQEEFDTQSLTIKKLQDEIKIRIEEHAMVEITNQKLKKRLESFMHGDSSRDSDGAVSQDETKNVKNLENEVSDLNCKMQNMKINYENNHEKMIDSIKILVVKNNQANQEIEKLEQEVLKYKTTCLSLTNQLNQSNLCHQYKFKELSSIYKKQEKNLKFNHEKQISNMESQLKNLEQLVNEKYSTLLQENAITINSKIVEHEKLTKKFENLMNDKEKLEEKIQEMEIQLKEAQANALVVEPTRNFLTTTLPGNGDTTYICEQNEEISKLQNEKSEMAETIKLLETEWTHF